MVLGRCAMMNLLGYLEAQKQNDLSKCEGGGAR